ncbi:MAG TPA: AsmA-like C-terminal region-containing protein [Pirellulales bacterium]
MPTGNLRTGLLLSLCWLLLRIPCAAAAAQPLARSQHSLAAYRKQAPPAASRPGGIQWTFQDIDIQTLLDRLKSFGVELPLPATGRVTVRLSIGAPWRSIFSADAYEVNGDLSSPELTVAGIELKNLSVHLQYKDGALDLSQMRFSVPGDGDPDGTISGTAHMRVQPPGDLNADLTIDQLPLSAMGGALPVPAGQISGSASGQFSGQAPADRLRDLAAWQAEGRLTLADFAAFGLPAAQATTTLRLSQGQATITQLTANLAGARFDASGQLSLNAPYKFTSRLRATVPDLDWLNRLDADFRPPLNVAGEFSVSATADGQLASKKARVRGTLEGRRLQADKLTIDHLQVPFEGTLESIRVRNLQLALYGGRIKAHLNLPTARDGNIGVGARIDNVDLARAATDLLGQQQDWSGVTSGLLQLGAPIARLTELDAWSGRGSLAFGRGTLFGIDVSRMATKIQITDGRLNLSELAVASALAQVTGSAQANLTAPFAFSTALRIAQVDFAALNRLPERLRPPAAVRGQADVSLHAQGALQPFDFAARGGVASRQLRADRLAVDSLNFNFQLSPKTLSLSQIAGVMYGGRFDGSANVGLNSPHDFALKLKVANANLSLANALPDKLRPPVSVGGAANVSAAVTGQLTPLNLHGGGSVNARHLRVAGARFDSLSFNFAGENDLLNVSDLSLIAYSGRLDGRLSVPLAAQGAASIDVRWQRLNLGALLTDLRGVASRALAANAVAPGLGETLNQARAEGWTWGSLAVNAPPGKLLEPAAWTGQVDIALAAMRLFGWTAKQGFIKGGIAAGRADLTRLALDVGDTRLRGAARLNLSQPYDFNSRFALDRVQLSDFNALPETIRPPVELSGTVNVSATARGTLEPLEITGSGALTGNALRADGARLDRLAVRFDADKNQLALSSFQADLYGGQITGNAEVALRGNRPGRVDFNLRQVNLGQLMSEVAKLPVALRGTLDGKLHIDSPGGKLAAPLDWNVAASFDTSPLGSRSVTIAELHGQLTYNGQLLDYRLNGELLRGAIDAAGRWQPRPVVAQIPLPLGEGRGEGVRPGSAINEGHFRLQRARLETIAALLGTDSAMGSLTGTIGADVAYRHAENGLPTGAGRITIDDLRLNGGDLLDELRGRILLAADRVEITDVNASLGGGMLNMSAVIYLDPRRRGLFRLNVDSADLAQLLAPWPRIAAQVTGLVDAQLRGFYGGRRPLILLGDVAVARGRAAGVAINGIRAPVKGSIDLARGRGTLELHGLTGQIAHGRVSGNMDVALADGLGLAGRGAFTDIDLRSLLQNSRSARRLAGGKITGSYTFAGRNVRTANDLTGTLNATLRDAQAMSLPVLERTVPYLTGGVSGSTTFGDGALRAALARGVVRIERFSLSSGSTQVYAQGKATLTGRLDLNVTVNTGQLNVPQRTLTMLASRVLLIAAPPVGLLLNVTQFLSNQAINLEVTGTVRAPAIRLKPLSLLGREAAQFFLMQALP